MATLVIADRVQETTTTTGTGTITLAGAVSGFRAFSSVLADTNVTYYTITSGSSWEVGLGTYATSANTLARTTILSSSASGSPITLAGTSTVFCDYPAGKAVYQDVNGNVSVDSFIPGIATIATASGTTTLTNSSLYFQRFTGTLAQTITLPDATTMSAGQGFIIDNDSTGTLALQNATPTSLGSVVPGMAAFVFCEDNTSVAGNWSGYLYVPGGGPTGQVTWGTAGLNMGGGTISGLGQLTSTVATGTAPFVVASTTQVANLNVATAGKVVNALTAGTNITFSSGTTFDGSAAITINASVTGGSGITLGAAITTAMGYNLP